MNIQDLIGELRKDGNTGIQIAAILKEKERCTINDVLKALNHMAYTTAVSSLNGTVTIYVSDSPVDILTLPSMVWITGVLTEEEELTAAVFLTTSWLSTHRSDLDPYLKDAMTLATKDGGYFHVQISIVSLKGRENLAFKIDLDTRTVELQPN